MVLYIMLDLMCPILKIWAFRLYVDELHNDISCLTYFLAVIQYLLSKCELSPWIISKQI